MQKSTRNPGESPIALFLTSTQLGRPRTRGRLTLWPLLLEKPPATAAAFKYEPLSRGLDDGTVVIEETSTEGTVPHIRVRNQGVAALLVLFGEELKGAKQNRIANASFLIPGMQEVVIDVSCVEQGRWSHCSRTARDSDSPAFGEVGSVVSHSLRRKMSPTVHAARDSGSGYQASQTDVWDEVSHRLRDAKMRSPTAAYDDYFKVRRSRLERVRSAFKPRDGQVGFVAAIDGQIVGLEAIGRPSVFCTCFERLLDAYAIDALDRRKTDIPGQTGHGPEPPPDPEAFLENVRQAPVQPALSLGLGEDLRIKTDDVTGCALAAGELVHLTAAPTLELDPMPDPSSDPLIEELRRALHRRR